MFKIFLFLFLVLYSSSCGDSLKRTKNYKIALDELSLHDYSDEYVLLSDDKMNNRKVYDGNDTINLMRSKKEFAFQHLKSKNIFIYIFDKDGSYKRIKCDSAWRS